MPKPKKGARFGGSASHQKKILSNLAAQLFVNHAIKTTDAKAKLLRPYAEKLITKAKAGTVSDRRNALKLIPNKEAVNYLFDVLAPSFAERNGGYTRIIKLENRKGDNAPMSRIELVLEEVSATDNARQDRVAASKAADEAPEVEADEATDAAAADEAAAVEAEEAAEEK